MNNEDKTKIVVECKKKLLEFPKLGDIFFSVIQTALRETSWKYKDLPLIQNVEAQLVELNAFALKLKEVNELPIEAPEALSEPQKQRTVNETIGVDIKPEPTAPQTMGAETNPAPEEVKKKIAEFLRKKLKK